MAGAEGAPAPAAGPVAPAGHRGAGTARAATAGRPPADGLTAPGAGRLAVRKTYKLYIGGAFLRSESGRSYKVTSAGGLFLANVAWASRKDLRDAVVAARKGQPGWAGATAYLRGQILYRAAEMLEGRRAQFAEAVALSEGTGLGEAAATVDASVDRLVWYAGWSDKIAQVGGSSNPVAGPYFNFSVPEPTGVAGVLAPQASSLLGLVSVLAPVVVSGNSAVVVASQARPLPAVELAEVLATSDLPGGVVNVLTGPTAELAPVLAGHRDIEALDLAGAPEDLSASLEESASTNVKRVLRPRYPEPDWSADPSPARMLFFTETKTVWHPMGN